jgi:WD40 repeat protein
VARIFGQVLQRGDRITFIWSEGAASFEPYHLEGAERAGLLDIAGQIHAKLESADSAELARLGHQLYRAVFRRDAGDYGSAEAVQAWLAKQMESNSVEKLEFLSDAPGLIPWNVLCESETAGFWGSRFNLGAGRRVNALRQNSTQTGPMQFCAADPELIANLSVAQQALLNPLREANLLATTTAALRDGLNQRAPDILLLLARVEKGLLRIGADSLSSADLQRWLAVPKEGNPDPLIILMASGESTEQVAYQALLSGASAAFNGLVANETLLSATKAFEIGHSIAQRFADGKQSLGEILRTLRQEQGPPALAFTAFCPPQLRVVAEEGAPAAELPLESVPLPAQPYRPFAAFDVEDRALFCGREDDVLAGAFALDHSGVVGVFLHGSPAVGKTSYLQAGLIPYLEQESIGYRALRDRAPGDTPVAEKDHPVLILRCTNDLAGQFADALTAYCAQPFVYSTPAGTQVTVDLPKILQDALSATANPGSTAIQSAPAATSITATPGGDSSDDDDGESAATSDTPARELWIALRDNKDMLALLLDKITRSLPFELMIVIDQGEDLVTLVRTSQQQGRRQKAIEMLMQLSHVEPRCKVVFAIRSQALAPFVSLLPDERSPADWQPFHLRPLTENALIDVLTWPTSRGEVPYCGEIPFQKYGFEYEAGLAAQIAAEAMEASGPEQQGALSIVHAVGALLYEKAVLEKTQNMVRAVDLKEVGGVKDALSRYLDRSIDKLTPSKQARQALRDLIGKLYTSHPDGSLSRDLIAQGELKSLWIAPGDAVEPLVDRAVQEQGLFDVQELIIGGESDLFISLPQDSLAQVGKKVRGEREQQALLRGRMVDVLWIMIPLVFLAAAVTFWGTRKLTVVSDPDEIRREFLKEEIMPKLEEILLSQERKDILKFQRPTYVGQMAQVEQALLQQNGTRVRQLLLNTDVADLRKYKLPDLRGFDWNYAWRQVNCERHTLEGHKGAVHAVAASPDGKWAASVGSDGATRIWTLDNGKTLVLIPGTKNALNAVAFAPDGKSLAVGGADKIVRIYDLSNVKTDYIEIHKESKALPGHEGEVHAIAFGKDATTLASAGADKTVIVWDVAAGKEKHKLKEHSAAVFALAFAADGTTLISAGDEGDFIIWDAAAGKRTAAGKTAYRSIAALAVGPDGKLCTAGVDNVAGAEVGMIRFWTIPDAKEAFKAITLRASALAVAFSPDGKSLVTGGRDEAVRLWNVETGEQERYFLGHTDPIRGLAFTKDAILSASVDQTVKIWDSAKSSGPDVIKAHKDWVQALALGGKDTLLASGSRDGAVKLWDPKTGLPAKVLDGKGQSSGELPAHKSAIAALAFSSSADKEPLYLAVGTRSDKNEGEIKVWQFDGNAKDGWKVKELATLTGHKKGITCLKFHPDAKKAELLASGSADQTVKLWDVKTQKEEASFDGHKDEVRCVTFSFDNSAIFSGGRDKAVCYNDLRTKKVRTFKEVHTGSVESIVAFGRVTREDEHGDRVNVVVTGGADLALRFWGYDQTDPDPDAKRHKFRDDWPHSGPLTAMVYHEANNGMIASAGWEGAVKLHDMFGERFTLSGHQDAVRALVMAADQSFIASASNDRTIRIWRTLPERAAAKKGMK